jgi:anionic cell wall polymer biosynthesis LytR-Cps2A-Psr (LCP) family protein
MLQHVLHIGDEGLRLPDAPTADSNSELLRIGEGLDFINTLSKQVSTSHSITTIQEVLKGVEQGVETLSVRPIMLIGALLKAN